MRAVSRKRAAALRIYSKRRAEFLANHPWCLRCGGLATEIHHRAGRVAGHITAHPAESIDRGWSLPRVGAA